MTDLDMERLATLFEQQAGFPLAGHCVLLGYVGSIAHGTHVPSNDPDSIDDIDTMGVVIPPPHRTLGAWGNFEGCVVKEGPIDAVFYSLQKFVGLLGKANPNVLGTLWLDAEHLLIETPASNVLASRRMLFSTLRAYDAFVGYAYGQLHRMEAFDLTRMEEYEHLTARLAETGIVAAELLSADGNKLVWFKKQHGGEFPPDQMDRFRSLHKQYFSGYMGAKRKALVKRVGYDAKNAAHLIRLMRMCVEFLVDGVLRVDRTGIDAPELKAIKAGEWGLVEVKAEAERLFAEAKGRRATCPLPSSPPDREIHELVASLHRQHWEAP